MKIGIHIPNHNNDSYRVSNIDCHNVYSGVTVLNKFINTPLKICKIP